jgi:prepilin-type processing-associated H-X9-DG protein
LLLVIAILAVLCAFLLPTLARGKAKAQTAACISNQRQLGYAFLMYLHDNDDIFPTAAAHSGLGAQPEDWIWWQVDVSTRTMRDPSRGAIVPYLGKYNPRSLRCPIDRDAPAREVAWRQNPGTERYFYSYSLNAYSDRGMASYFSKDRSMIFLNRLGSVLNPAQKIMLAEEKGGPSDGPGTATIDDGRWVPPGYPLTVRHSGRANVTFADGHAQSVRREFADSCHPEHYDPAH